MPFYPHRFEAEIVHHDVGTYRYTVVFLDPALHGALPTGKARPVRVDGEVSEVGFEGAFQPVSGRWYLMLSKKLLREGEMKLGDTVEVRFRLVDPDTVDVPLELQQALRSRAALRKAWQALTPGQQRGFCHHLTSAKRPATRQKRLAEILDAVEAGRKTMAKHKW